MTCMTKFYLGSYKGTYTVKSNTSCSTQLKKPDQCLINNKSYCENTNFRHINKRVIVLQSEVCSEDTLTLNP